MLTDKENCAFVEQLKPGDKVFVYTVGGCGFVKEHLSLKEVERITKSHIVVIVRGNEQKFRKDNLEEVGRKFGRMYMGDAHDEIVEYNPYYIAKYERQQKKTKCSNIIKFLAEKKLSDLSDDTLNKYHDILIQFEKSPESYEQLARH